MRMQASVIFCFNRFEDGKCSDIISVFSPGCLRGALAPQLGALGWGLKKHIRNQHDSLWLVKLLISMQVL
jgi:hypothetical protein